MKLKVGQYVQYVEGEQVRDGLIQIVFSERDAPHLTIWLVRPGERGLTVKSFIPHESRWDVTKDRPGFWRLPVTNGEAKDHPTIVLEEETDA